MGVQLPKACRDALTSLPSSGSRLSLVLQSRTSISHGFRIWSRAKETSDMSVEQNKAISRRIPDEEFEQGRLGVVGEICAPDFIRHGTPPPGIPAARQRIKRIACGH